MSLDNITGMAQFVWQVRCYACGGILAPARDSYEAMLAEGIDPEECLDRLGYRRTCCRMYILYPGQLAPGLFVKGGATRQTNTINLPRTGPSIPAGLSNLPARPLPPLAKGGLPPSSIFGRLGKPVAVLAPGTAVPLGTVAPITQISVNDLEVPKRPFRAN